MHANSRIQIYKTLLAQQQHNLLQQEFAKTQNHAWELAGEVKIALDAQPPLTTLFPANNSLAANLNMVAKIISARGALNVRRQTFFIGMATLTLTVINCVATPFCSLN